MSEVYQDWFEEPESICEQCEQCPQPNGCIRSCLIKEFVQEDVAKIRGENQ